MIIKRVKKLGEFEPFSICITFETAEETEAILLLTSKNISIPRMMDSDDTSPTYKHTQRFLHVLREEMKK